MAPALPGFGYLSCVSAGSDSTEGFRIFQILPVFATCGQVFAIPVLQSSGLGTEDGQVEACGSLAFCCKHRFGGHGCLCILSPKSDRLKVTRAGPELTVTEITPAQEAKKGKANGTLCLHGDGRGVARKPQDLKMHMT